MNGFVIAKPGFDAGKARETDDYVTTKAPILKVSQRGKDKISFGTVAVETSQFITINHNLGYKPLVLVFADRRPLGQIRMVTNTTAGVTGDIIFAVFWVEDNTFTIRFVASPTFSAEDPTGIYRYFWYVFSDPGESF